MWGWWFVPTIRNQSVSGITCDVRDVTEPRSRQQTDCTDAKPGKQQRPPRSPGSPHPAGRRCSSALRSEHAATTDPTAHQQTPPPPPFFFLLYSLLLLQQGSKLACCYFPGGWCLSRTRSRLHHQNRNESVSARPVISASRIRGRKPAPLLPARQMRAWNDPELRQNHGCLPPRPFDPNLMSGRFSTNQKGVFVSRVPTAGWGYCHISICHLFTLRFPVSATGKWFTFSIF